MKNCALGHPADLSRPLVSVGSLYISFRDSATKQAQRVVDHLSDGGL